MQQECHAVNSRGFRSPLVRCFARASNFVSLLRSVKYFFALLGSYEGYAKQCPNYSFLFASRFVTFLERLGAMCHAALLISQRLGRRVCLRGWNFRAENINARSLAPSLAHSPPPLPSLACCDHRCSKSACRLCERRDSKWLSL